MALHPTDDRELTDDSPRSTSAGIAGVSRLTVLAAVFAVVIVASLGLLAYGLLSDAEASSGAGTSDDPAAREAVMSQADQFVLRANTYGPADLDEGNALPQYAEQVREVITPKFEVAFDSSLTLAEQTVAEAGYARDVDLYATGVQNLGEDDATVLVAGVFTGSYPDTSAEAEEGDRIEFEPQPFRYTVSLVKIDGEWLVDDFSPLTSEIEDPLAPGDPADPADPSGELPPAEAPAPEQAPDLTPQQRTPSRGPAS